MKFKSPEIKMKQRTRSTTFICRFNNYGKLFLDKHLATCFSGRVFKKIEIRKVIACDSYHVTLGFIPSFAETNRGVTSLPVRLWKELWCKQRPILPLQVFPSP